MAKGLTLGEVVAAVGVIVSLLFVGAEIRQTNQLARAEAYRSTASDYAQLASTAATDDRLNHLLGRVVFGNMGAADITNPDDAQRLGSLLTAWVKLNESVYYQVQEEVLDSTAYSLMGGTIGRSRYVREAWSGIGLEVTPEFARFFEARFALPPVGESSR